MKTTQYLIAFGLQLLLLGCGDKANREEVIVTNAEEQAYFAAETSPAESKSVIQESSSDFSGSSNVSAKIIRHGNINIEVKDYLVARQQIDSLANLYEAAVISESHQENETQRGNSISIRVPAEKFDLLLGELAKIAHRVDYQQISTEDVTTEYIDVNTRLQNKMKVERNYQRLLSQATSVDDILKIENQLGAVRAEIESLQGRMNYINHQVSKSLITVYVYQKVEYRYRPDEMPSFGERIKQAINAGWKGLVWLVVFIIKIWPIWLAALVVFVLVNRLRVIGRRRKAQKKEQRRLEKKLRKYRNDKPSDTNPQQ